MDQDSLLSAYLDGHADPEQRRRAEAILASDPSAVEALRSLAGVRDLVAGLSRPRGPDVSALVLDRIVANAGRRRPWKAWGPYLGRGLGASAIAASLGLVVVLGLPPRPRGPSDPPAPRAPEAPGAFAARTPAPTAVPPPVAPPEPVAADSAPASTEVRAPAPVVAEAERPTPGRVQPAGFQELWAADGPRRDFVVTSAPDEATIATVATLLGLSTHRDFYKIVVPEGGVAAGGPGAAVAFAARLDPSEFATLRGRLGSKFGDRMAIGDSEPEIAALLAEVGQVTAAAGTPAAEVSFPQTQHAFRVRPDARPGRRAEADAAAGRPDDPPVAPPSDPTGPSVVVVWVVDPASN